MAPIVHSPDIIHLLLSPTSLFHYFLTHAPFAYYIVSPMIPLCSYHHCAARYQGLCLRCVSASSDPVLRFLVGLDSLGFWICALLGVHLIHLCFSANARRSRVWCADGMGVLTEDFC